MARIAPKLPRGTFYTRFCTRNNMCTRIDTNFLHCVHEMTHLAIYIYIYTHTCTHQYIYIYIYQFPKHHCCLWCLSARCRFLSYDLWNAVVRFQPPSLFIRKVWVPVIHFCVCPMHCKVHRTVGRRLGLCRLTSA